MISKTNLLKVYFLKFMRYIQSSGQYTDKGIDSVVSFLVALLLTSKFY